MGQHKRVSNGSRLLEDEAVSHLMPDSDEAVLPPLPPGMSRSYFGKHVMQWRTGDEAPIARIKTIAASWLVGHGVTAEMMRS
jgi:hypothetical protein